MHLYFSIYKITLMFLMAKSFTSKIDITESNFIRTTLSLPFNKAKYYIFFSSITKSKGWLNIVSGTDGHLYFH